MDLDAARRVPWTQPKAAAGITPQAVYLGPDPDGLGSLQVATAEAAAVPSRTALRELYMARRGRRQITLVVAVTHGDTAYLLGPDPQAATVELPVEAAQRQLQSALSEPDVELASERLANFRKAHESTAPGFTNSGLFATHHVMTSLPTRLDWASLCEAGRAILTQRDASLIKALGFRSTRHTANALLLASDGHPPRAVAVLIDATEQFDQKSARLSGSPVAYGLAIAQQQEIPWLVVIRKDQIRLYPGRDGVGVGAKGQTETYFEIDLATIDSDHAALLPLIFSAAALAADGSTDQILADSARYATELGKRLRERIYGEVVPPVAVEVAHQLAMQGRALDAEGLATAYQVTLRILFRLLFQAYAEDRGLLPAGRNEGFDANSLKSQGRRLLDAGDLVFGEEPILWRDLEQVWLAIDKGQPLWQVPAYNGGLFASDAERSPDGALIASIELPDRVLAPALRSLLVDRTEDGTDGLVDFRSLSVREFGTIYEGLLESSLSQADQDLTEDANGSWVPAHDGDEVLVRAGGVYFHSASGERKATGSYFTPRVVVDHLIERSIVPVLTKHLDRIAAHLAAGDAAAAARDFFDFRVADLAMGSGHFLVAAIDKIEALMRTFLTQHTVSGVTEELRRLAEVAKEALGTDDAAKLDVDEVGLLRRQIARRCIYGLDINLMAVELGRLALWIHTFVPGLPMSNLDHGLVCANSLTGIGAIEEAVDALAKVAETTFVVERTESADDVDFEQDALFGEVEPTLILARKRTKPKMNVGYKQAIRTLLLEHLDRVTPVLLDVANASEATKAEVEAAAAHLAAAREASAPIARLFDAAVAVRLGEWTTSITNEATLRRLTETTEPSRIVAPLQPAHMPVLFPEVFVRENPGFDVLLGNPPWEELQVEEPKFWLRVRPGLLGLKPKELKAEVARLRKDRADLLPALEHEVAEVAAMRKVLLTGPYPGLGTGDIDLYNAFAWRFAHLVRETGAVAIVMPRSILASAGGAEWRRTVFPEAQTHATTLVNRGKWVFDLPDGDRITVALLVVSTASGSGEITLAGPFFSESDFRAGADRGTTERFARFVDASAEATIPDFPRQESVETWSKLREAPRLDARRTGWDFRPVSEFHATNDRHIFDSGHGPGDGRLPVFSGRGFNLWQPETGEVYAWADPAKIEDALFAKRRNQVRLTRSAFHGLTKEVADDTSTLPFHRPRIAFRDIARATDSRTVIAALVPGETALTNKAPYLLRREGSAGAEAFLLGALSSVPLDWYSRRYVELGMNLHIFNGLPVPVYLPEDAACARVVDIAGRLAAIDDRYGDWADEVGVPVGSVISAVMKEDLVAELDALVALRYGLTEEQLVHIFATFHRGWDYQPRLGAALAHFRTWRSKA
ncbi:Eco57I restriction-modification methylase domain-containing protein [Cellulosimicrobium protaetiae]